MSFENLSERMQTLCKEPSATSMLSVVSRCIVGNNSELSSPPSVRRSMLAAHFSSHQKSASFFSDAVDTITADEVNSARHPFLIQNVNNNNNKNKCPKQQHQHQHQHQHQKQQYQHRHCKSPARQSDTTTSSTTTSTTTETSSNSSVDSGESYNCRCRQCAVSCAYRHEHVKHDDTDADKNNDKEAFSFRRLVNHTKVSHTTSRRSQTGVVGATCRFDLPAEQRRIVDDFSATDGATVAGVGVTCRPLDANVSADADAVKRKFNRANKNFYNGMMQRQDNKRQVNVPQYQAHAAELLHFLKSLWMTNTMCDLCIVIEQRRYPAHRLGLAMFSRKYCAEFERQAHSSKDTAAVYTIELRATSHQALESILRYIYTAKIDINPANVEELLAASHELGIDDLVRLASDYLSSLSIGDVLAYMGNVLDKDDGSKLMFYELYAYMMTHLDKISKTPEYLQASLSSVRALLNDSSLSVRTEVQVFDAALRWIDADRHTRAKHVCDVMRNVRFTLMTPDELVSKVEAQLIAAGYFAENGDGDKKSNNNNNSNNSSSSSTHEGNLLFSMVSRAYKYHALRNAHGKLASCVRREEERGACLNGASVPDEFVKAIIQLSEIAHRLKEARTNTTSNIINYGLNDEFVCSNKSNNLNNCSETINGSLKKKFR